MSGQEQKINNMLERIRHTKGPVGCFSPPSRPQLDMGMAPRKRPQDLSFATRTASLDSQEMDKKLKEIMKISGTLSINNILYKTNLCDMQDLEELGNGTCGHVVKMRHKPSGHIIAVKQMRRSGNSEDNKRIIMDIEVILKSHDCKYIVQCYGCFITDSEVWICMELMNTCFDKLLKRLKNPIPEPILGKVTVATVEALSYLKEKHGVIHRDVKPSNILVDAKGQVKLCDFGISGRLKDSMAQTRSTGCAAYLAPERIEPDPKNPDYDIRADVWSLGITLVELATGVFPYQDCKTDFEVLTKVIGQEPPQLPASFSADFRDFVKNCLIKDPKQRPKYDKLKNHIFIKRYARHEHVNVGEWVVNALQQLESLDGANRAVPRRTSTGSNLFSHHLSKWWNPQRTLSYNHHNHHQQHAHPVKSTHMNGHQYEHHHQHFYHHHPSRLSKVAMPMSSDFTLDASGHRSRLASFQYQSKQSSCHEAAKHTVDPSTRITTTSQFDQHSCHKYEPTELCPSTSALIQSSSPIVSASSRLHNNNGYESSDSGCTRTRWERTDHQNPTTTTFRVPPIFANRKWRSPSAGSYYADSQLNPLYRDGELYGTEHQHYNCGNTSPIVLQRFYHQQKQQRMARDASDPGKKRIPSYLKAQLSVDRGDANIGNSRHLSPDPPPRHNRNASLGRHTAPDSSTFSHSYASSNDTTPTATPCLSRRYVSPLPTCRLSESSSTPGSPQHYRSRFAQYTPEPQRRYPAFQYQQRVVASTSATEPVDTKPTTGSTGTLIGSPSPHLPPPCT